MLAPVRVGQQPTQRVEAERVGTRRRPIPVSRPHSTPAGNLMLVRPASLEGAHAYAAPSSHPLWPTLSWCGHYWYRPPASPT